MRKLTLLLLSALFFLWGNIAFGQSTEQVIQGTVRTFLVSGTVTWEYGWTLEDPSGSVSALTSTTIETEDITFDQLGMYILRVQATNDLGCLSDWNTKYIEVIEFPNEAPNANSDFYTMNQGGGPVSANLLVNDTDPEGDGLNLSPGTFTSENGTITFNASGNFIYTPNPDFVGTETFNYEVCDDAFVSLCDIGTVRITVVEVNTFNGVAINDINFVIEGSTTTGQVLANDINFLGSGITVDIPVGSEPIKGTASISNDGSYSYQPNASASGVDNFYYEVCQTESPSGCDDANVTVYLLPDDLTTVSLVAVDDEAETIPEQAVSGNVLANDFSPIGDVLIASTSSLSGPQHGTVTILSNGDYTYTPTAGYSGTDFFVYEVCSSISGECKQARVTVHILEGTGLRLFAVDDAGHLFSDDSMSGNLLLNDILPDGLPVNLNTTAIVSPQNGSVTISSNGDYQYTPSGTSFPYVDSFSYEICDESGNCSRATVYLIVSERPDVYADLQIEKLGPANIYPGDEIVYDLTVQNLGIETATQVVVEDMLASSVVGASYTINGEASGNWTGSLEIEELLADSSVAIQITGTLSMTVPDTLINYASVIAETYDSDLSNNLSFVETVVNQGPRIIVENGLLQTMGCCQTELQLDASASTGNGELSFLWEPSANLDDPTSSTPLFTGAVNSEYLLTVTDEFGVSSSETVTIEILPCPQIVVDNQVFVNNPADIIILDASASIGVGLTYNWYADQSGVIVSGSSTSNPQVMGIGKYYVQATDIYGCTSELDSVIVGLYVQIQAVNDTAGVDINSSVDINVLRNDLPEGELDPMTINITTLPDNGIAYVSSDSIITYTPNQEFVGQDNFVYAVCNYFDECDEATVLVIVTDGELFIPNAFSPNGDGYNDYFEILGIADYPQVSLKVFNRWGSLVFESSSYGAGSGKQGFWDGTVNKGFRVGSGDAPTGTYFYILDLGVNDEKLSGFIYMDR